MTDDFGAIDLARAAPFALGALEVRPATREVGAGGASEVLQPRIMQVLVALGSRPGVVVSRDDLIRTCWDGQVVGDDAINRCIAKLRQIGDAHGAFEIVTIARVGYRLDASGGAPVSVLSPTPVLAVLPFDNLSSDAEMQFFSDGVSEEVLTAASRIEGVRTIGRASSFQLRGAGKARAAADLKATHVLDGAVRRGGDRVRISAQLIETAGQTTLWSQTYERSLGDVFAIQDEIAAAIAMTLQQTLAAHAPHTPIDPIALDCFLRARSRWRNDDDRANDALLALLEEAVQRAPNYAPAWALLARVRELNAAFRRGDKNETRARALAAVERALELDPACSEALVAMAQMQPACGHFAERERLFLRALAAAPGDADVMHATAYFLASVGRSSEALAMARGAYETDPLSIQNAGLYGQFLTDERRFDEANALMADAGRRWPDSVTPFMLRIWVAAQRGDWATVDALAPPAALSQLLNRPTLAGRILDGLKLLRAPTAEGIATYRASAEQHLAETGSVRLGDVVFLCRLGERDAAFSLCERASFERHLRPFEVFDPYDIGPTELFGYERDFHNDPRFVTLCARLGLASYWVASGNWPDSADTTPYDFREACRRAVNEGGA